MKKVVIFSRNNFPNGDAGSVRDMYFGQIYSEFKYEVYSINLSKSDNGNYNNVVSYSVSVNKRNIFDKFKAEFGYKKRMIKMLDIIDKDLSNIKIFHVVDIPLNAIYYLKRIAKKKKILLIHDSVEWYSPVNFKGGIFHFGFIMKEILNRIVINKSFKVIAISTYLENYFVKKRIDTVRIPIIMDKADFNPSFKQNSLKRQIIYAGSPGYKDDINVIIESAYKLIDIAENISINIFGISQSDVVMERNKVDKLIEKGMVKFHGLVPRNDMLTNLAKSDFSIVVRDANRRYSKAGFPTKVVESLFSGIPVICNLTSDLGFYLKDNINSLILANNEIVESLSHTFEKLSRFDDTKILDMKKESYYTAINNFNYTLYKPIIKKLLADRYNEEVL